MKVKELIERLQKQNEDAEVFIYNASSEDDGKVREVKTINSFDETSYVKGPSTMNPKYFPETKFPVVCIIGE